MSSKYPIESELINLAREEYNQNGRSNNFVELENKIIKTCTFRDICEFAFTCKGADIKKIEKSITSDRGDEYVGGFYFLAKYVKGSNYKMLEQIFLDYMNSKKVITYDVVMAGVNFAINFKDCNVNEFFKVVVKSSLLPVDKILIAIQFAHMFNSIDIPLFKHFICWCKHQESDDLFKSYIKKLSKMVDDIREDQECVVYPDKYC